VTEMSIKNFVNDAPVMLNTPVIQGAELFPAYPSGTGRAEPGCSAQCKLKTIASRNRRPKLMQKTSAPLPLATGRALIIGKNNHKVDRLKRRLAEYFGTIYLLSDPEQLNSLAADSHSVVVVTDTLGDVLDYDFFANLRSLHPRARLLCLVDRISREAEKAMRSAGLLFLGSYDHFDDCYGSVLQTALWPQKANKHQPD